jgi:hypothetical protein
MRINADNNLLDAIGQEIALRTRDFLAVAIFVPPYPIFFSRGTELLFPLSLKCSISEVDCSNQVKNVQT